MIFSKVQIAKYTESLYLRRHSGIGVQLTNVENPNWQPEFNKCHDNASMFCKYSPDHIPVRGWLYFDFPLERYVKFLAHSVVKLPNDVMADITPTTRIQTYPFIHALLTDEEYTAILKHTHDGNFIYIPKEE